MTTQKVTQRRRGNVVTLVVEIDASQSRVLNDLTGRLGMTKTAAIAAALNVWFSSVKSPKESGV